MNPAYRGPADATEGLVARSCELVKIEGAIRITANGRFPFLGTARVKRAGPLKLRLTIRSTTGGTGRVQWKLPQQASFPEDAQSVAFEVPAGESWQELAIDLPIEGQPQIVRLYLPAVESPVEVKSIQFVDQRGRQQGWDFSRVSP